MAGEEVLKRAGSSMSIVGDFIVHVGGWDGIFNRSGEAHKLIVRDV